MKLSAKRSRKGYYVELLVETDFTESLVFLTPMEAERLGNALIKAALPKKQNEAESETVIAGEFLSPSKVSRCG